MRLFHISNKQLLVGVSCLSTLVSLLAVFAWGQSYGWQLSHLSVYQLFPLFGLLAFSLLWSQYIAGALQLFTQPAGQLQRYFTVTGYAVLLAILLHPGLLVYQRFHDGYGLPPGSYLSYVAPSLQWVALLGTVSFFILLAYELHRWFSGKSWWRYVSYLTDAAVLAIFYHSLRLGSQLMSGWFRDLWYVYGLTLVLALAAQYLFKADAHADLPAEK